MKSSSKPIEILGKLDQMAGFASDEEIELYEVCFPSNPRAVSYLPFG